MLPTLDNDSDDNAGSPGPAVKLEASSASKASSNKPGGDDIAKRRTLFVRSLPYSLTSEALSEKFSFIAPLKHAIIVADPATKDSRGFGFVTFTDAEDALRAIAELNGTDVDGRKIKVELAEPRHRDQHRQTGVAAAETSKKPHAVEKKRAPRLIVRNLPWAVKSEDQLVKVFQSYGKVKSVIIPKKKTGEMSGFAFVTMKGYKNAERAMEKINGKEIEGRPVAVDWALEKEDYQKRVEQEQEQEQKDGNDVKIKEEDASDDDEDTEDAEEGSDTGEGTDQEPDDDDEEYDGESEGDDQDRDQDEEEEDKDEDMSDDEASVKSRPDPSNTTLFIRNIPFSTTDEILADHFSHFGPVRYARVVMDPATDHPRGTAFVAFYTTDVADSILCAAPKDTAPQTSTGSKNSILQHTELDPSGQFTLDGRILSVTRAVDRATAASLEETSAATRQKRTSDKRRLYLLQEGAMPASSSGALSVSDKHLRDASLRQRKTLLQSDPNLHLSFTRLSVRNLPRWVTSKDLKALARHAIPGFASDVVAGLRQPLSKEEAERDGDDGRAAERRRRDKGVGVVKQAKVQLEKDAGRSRGYGFVEYWRHREALMGLRWLNGRDVPGATPQDDNAEDGAKKGKQHRRKEAPERKKRLIVEFALENAKVINRRKANEDRSREIAHDIKSGKIQPKGRAEPKWKERGLVHGKRKREDTDVDGGEEQSSPPKKRFREKKGKPPGKGGKGGKGSKGEGKAVLQPAPRAATEDGASGKKSYQERKDEKRAAAGIIRRKRMQGRAKRKASQT